MGKALAVMPGSHFIHNKAKATSFWPQIDHLATQEETSVDTYNEEDRLYGTRSEMPPNK